MIDTAKRDRAMAYLAETDVPYAKSRGLMIGLDKQEKTIVGMEILDQKGHDGTVAEKDARARNSSEYKAWLRDYEDAVIDYETYRNRRTTAALIVEVWRSEQSARTKGMVI